MTTHAKIKYALFTFPEIARLLERPQNAIVPWFTLYDKRRTTVSRDIDLVSALGTTIIGEGAKAGMPHELVALHVTPLVNSALLHLAEEAMPWPIRGDLEEAQRFGDWIAEVEGYSKTRRIQDLLGTQERKAARFLILKGGKEPLISDSLHELIQVAEEPTLAVIDVFAIANKIRKSRADPLFTVEVGVM